MVRSKLPILMAEHGYRSISDLQKKTGISRTTLTALYYGTGKGVLFETMETLCRTFNVGFGEILILEDKAS